MIIEAAMQLFSEKGFHGVSIDDIVQEVGVSPALLYQHFKSKEELYEAVQHRFACRREEYLDVVHQAGDDLEEVLRNMTHIFVRKMSRHPSILKMELHSLLDGSDASQEFFENRWKNFVDFIDYVIEEKTNEEEAVSINSQIAGLMFQGMIREALITKCLQKDDRFADKTIDQLVDELVTMFLAVLNMGSNQGQS